MLRFDFEDSVVCFKQPLEVISTDKLSEVRACFDKIETALENGFYVGGYVSYEAAPAFDPKMCVQDGASIPLLWFGVFDQKLDAPELEYNTNFHPEQLDWVSDTDEMEYQDAIKHIHHAIKHGDTYQINYTIRIRSHFAGETAGFYQHLKQAQQSSFCAHLDLGDFEILSASPELFFKRNQSVVTARPMKGTMPRGMTPTQDKANKQILAGSKKDQAENIMIVDLLRNDLGRLAELGSVKVPSLFEIEQYPSVWQMTSTVEAKLKEDSSCFELFKALFPCGSITGAPKISAMNLIAELEDSPRDVYCGAIGYFTPDKQAIFNVPIRTVLVDKKQQQATYSVGGGITWYSTAKAEYQEALDKAKIILNEVRTPRQLLESFLIEDGEIFLKDEHLARLKNSCRYFLFQYPEEELVSALADLVKQSLHGKYKARLLLKKSGEFELSSEAIQPLTTQMKATWSPFAINDKSALFYHKTTERQIYPSATLANECLLYNPKGEITEFVNGNVALLIDGEWVTPPVECGLLNGTMRQHLLSQGKLVEKILLKEDIHKAERITFMNSVRGWIEPVIFSE